MFEPKLGPITRTTGVAGQIAFTVTVSYPDLEAMYPDTEPTRRPVTFVGSVYGTPGPVVMVGALSDDDQEFVIEPERFGSAFNEEWVRRFYADRVPLSGPARTFPL